MSSMGDISCTWHQPSKKVIYRRRTLSESQYRLGKVSMLNLDFSSVPSREPLEEGLYELTILEVEKTTSKTKGTPMLKVTFEEPLTKTRIWENYVIQPNTLWKLKELLDAAGVSTEGDLVFDEADLIGTTYKAKVIQDTYNDQVVNRIKKIFAA